MIIMILIYKNCFNRRFKGSIIYFDRYLIPNLLNQIYYILLQIIKYLNLDNTIDFKQMKIQITEVKNTTINSSKLSQNQSTFYSISNNHINKINLIKKNKNQKSIQKKVVKYITKNSSIKTMCSEREAKHRQKKQKNDKGTSNQNYQTNQNRKIQNQNSLEGNQKKHDIQIQKVCIENYGIYQNKNNLNKPDFLVYTKDIVEYILKNQNHYISKNLLSNQSQITFNMRATLIQWLMQVHHKFQFLRDTLFLSVNIIDRILSTQFISKSKFQLLGITSLFIAAKYEEIRVPGMQSFVEVGLSAYTKQQIIIMEGRIMLALAFQMGYSSPLRFIDKTCLISEINEDMKQLSYAIAQLSLLDNRISGFKPSIIAQAILLLSELKLNEQVQIKLSNIMNKQLQICIKLVDDFLKIFKESKLYEEVQNILKAKHIKNQRVYNLLLCENSHKTKLIY